MMMMSFLQISDISPLSARNVIFVRSQLASLLLPQAIFASLRVAKRMLSLIMKIVTSIMMKRNETGTMLRLKIILHTSMSSLAFVSQRVNHSKMTILERKTLSTG
jgi:hypothetical protein